MFKINLSRPDFLYSGMWIVVLGLTIYVPAAYVVELNDELARLVIANILSFVCIYYIVNRTVKVGLKERFSVVVAMQSMSSFIKLIFIFWFLMQFFVVAYSGGIPLLWKLLDIPKNYMNYGVPSLSGLLNMIRAFMVAGLIFIYINSGFLNFKLKVILGVILILGVAEFTRANFMVFVLHGLAIWFMYMRIGILKMVTIFIIVILFILAFGHVGDVRGGHVDLSGFVGDATFFLELPTGFFWVYTYLVSPLNNISFAMIEGINTLYYPYYSIEALLPSVIREFFFEPQQYPLELATEAFNATSYYSPFIVDFGVITTFFIICILQFMVSFVHCKAMKGSLFHILCYPPLFMCVLLSIFYNFFFSMVVVLYPLLVACYMRSYKRLYRITYQKNKKV
jgi:oligosaccharide repeat unit polymerase